MTSTADDSGAALVREERRLGTEAGLGVVRITAAGQPTAADHRAAAARAWLSVARAYAAADAADEAYAAARSGLEELGDAYVSAEVDDDTTVKLLAAEDAHAQGLPHAADAMIRVLEDRLAMFFEAQRGRVVPVGEDG